MTTTVTSTIKSSGGDYTTLTAWEAAKQGDLTAAGLDQIQIAECYTFSGGLADNLTIDGSTTDSTHYLKVTVEAGSRHTGIPLSGFYITSDTALTTSIKCVNAYCQVEWVDVYRTGTWGTGFATATGGTNCTFTNCISNSTTTYAYYFPVAATAICCLAYSAVSTGFFCENFVAANFYNCVAANGSADGFRSDAYNSVLAKNCIAYNNATAQWTGSYNASSTNNATSTGSDDAPGESSVYGITSSNFVNAASNNFHLATGSNTLVGAGVDLSATFTTDIDGDTWPSGSAWDIGFDYRVSAGTTIDLTTSSYSWTKNTQQLLLNSNFSASTLNFSAQSTQNTQVINTTTGTLTETPQAIQNNQGVSFTAATLSFLANSISFVTGIIVDLTTASLGYLAKAVQIAQGLPFTTSSLSFSSKELLQSLRVSLSSALLSFTGSSISTKVTIGLGAATLYFISQSITVTGAVASAVARLLSLMGVGS